ncbi:MAG: DUF1311 domain-containing protein [Ottowia sp.]|nr:DUF1311 domain-containing protein [Ottowia sp.]
MTASRLALLVPLCALLAAQPAAALTDAQHQSMMRGYSAYAQADTEMNAAWRELRAALKSAGLEGQYDGGLKPPHRDSLLASQRGWLAQRDGEAERLRAGGSEVDGHVAALRARTAFLRRCAEHLRAFAALPAPKADAPFMRLLKERGGSLRFDTGGSFSSYVELEADGTARVGISGRPDNMPNRWKLLPDGSVRVAHWEGAEDYTPQDGRALTSHGQLYMLAGSDMAAEAHAAAAPAAEGQGAAPGRIYLNPNTPHYKNARYGFSLTLPGGQWEVKEATNGYGFTAKDDESDPKSREVRAWGTNSPGVLGQSLKDVLADAEGDFASITRREVDEAAGRFTLSGTAKAGGQLYVRGFVGKEVANIVRVATPDGWQAGFDVAVRAVEASFKPGF